MATTLYFNGLNEVAGVFDALDLANGDPGDCIPLQMRTSRGSGVQSTQVSTVNGPTSGVQFFGNGYREWLSPPLAAAVTISGSITWNLWASESNMSANAAINGIIEKVDGQTGAVTLIDRTARTTELGTSQAAANFAETPASGVACAKGDRLRVRIFADDAASSMASGFTVSFSFAGTTGGSNGDSFITLTETLSFDENTPAGTTLYPTDTASAVSTADVDREMWTSRGAGVATDVTNTVAGPTSNIQTTDTAGGTAVSWFSKPLQAFTLSGVCIVNARGLESDLAANAGLVAEIARVEGDGTSPTVWATGALIRGDVQELIGSEDIHIAWLAGPDLSITNGQRLRFRLYINDAGSPAGTMVSGHTVTTHYAGTSGGASGDTFLTFSQTLTEYIAVTVAGKAPTTVLQAINRAANWFKRLLQEPQPS